MDLKYILLIIGLVLLIAPGAALDGYAYNQFVSYSACDQSVYQQDVVIHRSAGTNYEETVGGLNVWHLYIGTNCQEDYGDVRFTNAAGTELAYFLWPGYDSTTARFCVNLQNANSAGTLGVWYGNPAVETTSNGTATYVFFDDFLGSTLDTTKWRHWLTGSTATVSDGVLHIQGGSGWAGIGSITQFAPGTIFEFRAHAGTHVSGWIIGGDERTATGSASGGLDAFGAEYGVSSASSNSYVQWRGENCSKVTRSQSLLESFHNLQCVWATNAVTYITDNVVGGTVSSNVPANSCGINFQTYNAANTLDIDCCGVRAYSATPPTATAFNGYLPSVATFTADVTTGHIPRSTLDGYVRSQTVEYSGTIQTAHNQKVVVHRMVGTNYHESVNGSDVWHIYVGDECKPDYGDIRFTDGLNHELVYHRVTYDAETATFYVRLEQTVDTGVMNIYYKNENVNTTSNAGLTYYWYDQFDSNLTDYILNNKSASSEIVDGRLKLYPLTSQHWGAYFSPRLTFPKSMPLTIQFDYSKPSGHDSALKTTQSLRLVTDPETVPRDTTYYYYPTKNSTLIWQNPINSFDMTATTIELDGMGKKRIDGGAWTVITGWADLDTTYSLEFGDFNYNNHPSYFDDIVISDFSLTPPVATNLHDGPIPTLTTAFTSDLTYGTCPVTVTFTDCSSGSPTTWFWDFGDGQTSTEQNPTHMYTTNGIYDVALTTTNEYGSDRLTKTSYIIAAGPNVFNRSIIYAASDQPTYHQDVMIHRTTGVNYEEFVDERHHIWHIYVDDDCKSDYGDIRFVDEFEQFIPYHLVTYTPESAMFVIRLEEATNNGMVKILYGSNEAITTSNETATYYVYDQFESELSNFILGNKSGLSDIVRTSIDNNQLTMYGTSGAHYGVYAAPYLKFSKTQPITIQFDYSKPSGHDSALKTAQSLRLVTDSETVDRDTTYYMPISNYTLVWRNPINSFDMTTTTLELDGMGNKRIDGGAWTTISGWVNIGETYNIEFDNYDYGAYPCYFDNIIVRGSALTPPTITAFTENVPEANFTAEPTTGLSPLTVNFTDLTAGIVTTWLWDFGDTQTSSEQHPVHTYTIPGQYTVTLTTSNTIGSNTTTKIDYIYVGTVPVAAFTANVTDGLTPLTVQFTDESTDEPTSWLWSFGDGTTDVIQNPIHTYTAAGTYTVNLTVTNEYGSTSEVKTEYITTKSLAVVEFDANTTSVYAYDPIQFTDQSTGTGISAYTWLFGDGQTATDQNPVHVYTTEGTYNVTLNVTNPAGTATLTKSNYISVVPVPLPTAAFTLNKTTIYPGETVLVTDGSSNDRFPLYAWNWSFGDGTWTNLTTNDPVAHTYDEPGSYDVTLYVTGYGGTSTLTKTVTVQPFPVPVVGFTMNKSTVYPNETILFTDGSTSQFPMTAWNWSFGDDVWINQTTSGPVEHAYTAPGTYTVTLYVTGEGGVGSKTSQITVEPFPVPTVAFTANRTVVYPNETILFTDGSTSEFPMYAWNWSFGDDAWINQTVNEPVEHAYVTPGSYNVTLYVTGEGGVGSKTTAVTVIPFPVPIVQFAANVTEEVRPMTVQFTDLSTYEPYQWYWDFGDGYDATEQHPVHTYRYEGTYPVTLTAWNVNGQNSTTKTGYITVNLPPLPTLRDLHIQNNGVTVTDYQVAYEVVNDDEFFGLLQSNPAHLEVYNGAGDQSYYFWIESFNTMTNSSKIWIKIPTLTGGGATTQVRLKYNDNREIPLSDGDKTFLLFDAFDTIGLSHEKWTIGGSPTLAVGSLHLTAGDSLVSTSQHPWYGVAIDARVKSTGSDLDLALSTAGTGWKTTGDGFGMTVDGDLTARAINDGSVTTETVPIAADSQYHVYTVYEIGGSLIYQRDGLTQKVIATNQPDTNLRAVVAGEGEVDWIFVRKFSTQDYVFLVPPVTAFDANVTKGVAPLTVQFTDTSENSPTSWAWDFGDGATSAEQSPTHTFTGVGNYTVTLTATNLRGSDNHSAVIAATLPVPVAAFTQNVTAGDEPLTVQFTDTSDHSPDRWLWTFGDGQTSTEQNPVHTYLNGGTYAVTLKVTSFAGTDTITVPGAVTVGNVYVDPVAAFSASATTVEKGQTIKFTDRSTNEPLAWSWTFGDGQTATTQHPSHTYATPGTYTVTLTVTNPAGANSTTTDVTVIEKMPVAAFSADRTVGDSPLTVRFTDRTTNGPSAWAWDFGDGSTSTEQNPTHTYATAGAYTVTLTATNVRGSDGETKTDYIRVDVPDVAFTADLVDGNKPLLVTFRDESTKDPITWSWNFGDGQTSTEQHPVHTYTAAGRYTVTLTATNANGAATLAKPQFVTVVELAPVAAFTGPETVDRYQYASFVDQSTNNPTTWEWTFGDGQSYTTTSYYYKNPSHRYTVPGTYTVTLKVTNTVGTHTTSRTITVDPVAPNAAFTATNTVGDSPLAVTFTDTSTNTPTQWFWEFGDGSNSTVQHPTHTYTASGTYSVQLTVTNAAGPASVTKPDLVAVDTPAVAMTATPAVGEKSLTVQFTDQSTNTPTEWRWTFGDGQTSAEQNPTHTYTAAGVYTVTLTATNTYGTTTKSFPGAVTVYELAPVAAFATDVTGGSKPVTVQFTDQSANNPTGWSWSFGDGATSTDHNPSHTYTDAGVYTVKLTATNPKGSHTITKTNLIVVEEIAPIAAFTVDHTYMIAGQDVWFTDQSVNNPTSWFWQFGDGQTSSLKNPRHAYTAPGTYTVSLRVTNEQGQSDLVKINYVTVDTHLPIADFECSPILGAAPLTVQFTDESEFLPYQWSWDFGDGQTSSLQHPTHTYTEPGTYTVSLRASNAIGSDTMLKSDIITVRLPQLNFSADKTMGGSPMDVRFTVENGDPRWTYHWSFGDGTTSAEQSPTHTYKTFQDQEFFTVALTVSYGGEEQTITKPNYIDVRTKSLETFMAEQQENIEATVTIGAVATIIAGIIAIYIGL